MTTVPSPFPLSPSLWAATAVAPPTTIPLRGDARTEVAVVGGGYAGLSTALHLARRGIRATLVEAREIGFGGSGRNGGQVIPGLKHDPDELMQRSTPEAGARLVDFAGSTADAVFDLIDYYQMDVPHVRRGWIQGAHTDAALAIARRRAKQWAQRGAPVRMLDKQQIADLLGTSRYLGGWIDERAGAIQPLSYARELARAAMQEGAGVHTDSPVARLERNGSGWLVTGENGFKLQADKVIVCTNAYGGGALVPKLNTTIIDANTFQVATQPLPEALRATVMPGGQVCSDTRNLLLYFRLDHTGRLLMGGRGPFREPKGVEDWAHLERVIRKMFPQIGDIGFDYRWCGRVAITRDYMPHIHEPEQGLLVNVGCQGRGVGLQTRMGQALAEYTSTGNANALPVPVTPIKSFPLYGLRRIYVNAAVTWYRLNDGGL